MKKTLLTLMAGVAVVGMSASAQAANIPCSTAKLIVPWKAGGGTHVLFSIFEKTIAGMDAAALEERMEAVRRMQEEARLESSPA